MGNGGTLVKKKMVITVIAVAMQSRARNLYRLWIAIKRSGSRVQVAKLIFSAMGQMTRQSLFKHVTNCPFISSSYISGTPETPGKT